MMLMDENYFRINCIHNGSFAPVTEFADKNNDIEQ